MTQQQWLLDDARSLQPLAAHETYKDNREAELQYLDELPAGAQLANDPVRVLAFGNIGLCG